MDSEEARATLERYFERSLNTFTTQELEGVVADPSVPVGIQDAAQVILDARQAQAQRFVGQAMLEG